MDNILYILDSHALIYRAYHAFAKTNLRNTLGFPTGACYGFAQYLMNIMQKYRPTHMVAVMDSGKPNWRHQKYPEYKKNRSDMPDELKVQLPKIKELIQAFGIPLLIEDGIEADDLICSVVRKYDPSFKYIIFSKDKDLMQLIAPGIVSMISPEGSGLFKEIDHNYVYNKFGVPPYELDKYLALIGDSSDNIPGVPKIGPVKARNIIDSGVWNEAYNHPDYLLSLELIRLKNYPELVKEPHEYALTGIDFDTVYKIFDKLHYILKEMATKI
jgi:DNA polymerase-1